MNVVGIARAFERPSIEKKVFQKGKKIETKSEIKNSKSVYFVN